MSAPVPFSFVVTVADDGETATEWCVDAVCDRLPRGPGDLSWFPTRVLTSDGAASLDIEVLNLINSDYLEELVLDALMWLEREERAS